MKLRFAGGVLIVLLAGGPLPASQATRLVKQARRAEKKGRVSDAYLLYSQAALLVPKNKLYRAKADALEPRAAIASNVMPPESHVEADAAAPETAFDDFKPGEPQPPPALHGPPASFDLDLHGDSKHVFQQVAQMYGFEAIFDSDYDAGPLVHIRLDHVDYRGALGGLEAATNSFVVPIAPKLFLVARDTPQKRADLEQTITVSVPIPQATTSQELIELAQTIRQVMDIQKIGWDTKSNKIVMRDRVSRVAPARALLEQLLSFRPQVVVELQLIEIRKSDITNLGATIPNMFNVAFTGFLNSTSTTTTTGSLAANTLNPFPFGSRSYDFIAIATQAGGAVTQAVLHGLFPTSLSMFSIGIGEAQLLANFSQSLGRNVLTAELRATNAQPATFHLGDRYPIVTGSYSAGVSVQTSNLPPPAFTFEDLGVNLRITPHVHGMEEVTLDVESDFKLLTGQSVNGNPIISTRKLNCSVHLLEEEWGVVAGLTQKMDSRTVNGTVGIARVPVLGQIFSQRTKEIDDTEILVLMKPHLLSLPGNQRPLRQLRVGTESRPYLPL